jgi:hypothetical protein
MQSCHATNLRWSWPGHHVIHSRATNIHRRTLQS